MAIWPRPARFRPRRPARRLGSNSNSPARRRFARSPWWRRAARNWRPATMGQSSAHAREKDAESVLLSYTDAHGAQQFLADIQDGLKTPVEQKWSALWSPAVRGSLFEIGRAHV